MALAVVSCGGGGGSTTTPTPGGGGNGTTQSLGATVVVPKLNSMQVLKVKAGAKINGVDCPVVPDGYLPLVNATVDFLDANDAVVGQAQTDACGQIKENVATTAVRAVVHGSGYRDIDLNLEQLSTNTQTVVSTISTTSDYDISVMQLVGTQKVAFVISDAETGKAVLGLGPKNLETKVDGVPVNLTSVGYSASTAEAASISLVLDASGSMGDRVDENDFRAKEVLAYDAAHTFLDGLTPQSDELAVVIFDTTPTLMNTANFNSLLWPIDLNTQQPVAYQISDSGLTKDIQKERLVIEAYGGKPFAEYLGSDSNGVDTYSWSHYVPHPEATPNIVFRVSNGMWGGGTALYDALIDGVNVLGLAANNRRIVVALTDGIDTFSAHGKADVIALSKAQKIPLYLIGLGREEDIDSAGMKEMAEASGGEYKHALGDVVGLFQSIQTGIRFQYLGVLPYVLMPGQKLELTLVVNGSKVSRTITAQ